MTTNQYSNSEGSHSLISTGNEYPGQRGLDPEQYPWQAGTNWDCIIVDKVYASCGVAKMNEEIFDLSDVAEGEIQDVECKWVRLFIDEDHPFTCEKRGRIARVTFWYQVKFNYEDESNEIKSFISPPLRHREAVEFTQEAEYGPDDQRLVIKDPRIFVKCEVFLSFEPDNVDNCFPGPEDQEVTVCVNKYMVFKLVANVQLKVWAKGFCVPEVCEDVEAECPPAERLDPEDLYPPQPKDDNGHSG